MNKIDKNKIRTWFITGASSGIGFETAKQALSHGYNVVALARRTPKIQGALCLSCDVTQPDQIQDAINKALSKYKNLDVLINCAGKSCHITAEEESLEHMREMFEVNYFGTFTTCNALLPHFRKQGHGTIVNVSSMNGLSPRLNGSAYCSTKYAIEGLTGSMWMETYKFCRIMACEFGFIPETNLVNVLDKVDTKIDEYKNLKNIQDTKDYHYYCNNKLKPAISALINTIEQEKLPRRLILGYDAIEKTKVELKSLAADVKASSKYTKSINAAKLIKTKYAVKETAKKVLPQNTQSKIKAKLKSRNN